MSKAPNATAIQLYNAMRHNDLFAGFYLDEVSHQIRCDYNVAKLQYKAGETLDDPHEYLARVALSEAGTETTDSAVHSTFVVLAKERARNPVKDYLNSLQWDGTPRLNKLLADFGGATDDVYTHEVTSKTFIAAVARIFQPGCKVDTVMILEGEQGIKKSTFFEVMGGKYALSAKIDPDKKDTLQQINSNWFIIIDEFASFKRAELDTLKAFTSCRIDQFRPPYGRNQRDFARQCVFVATINGTENQYLEDVTGNRRWWPLTVTKIDLDKIKEVRDQLWAEARARYEAGEVWHIDETVPEIAKRFAQEQSNRTTTDAWEGPALRFIMAQKKPFTQEDIMGYIGVSIKDQNQGYKGRVGKILTKFGLKGTRSYVGNVKLTVYDAVPWLAAMKTDERKHLTVVYSEAGGPVSPEEEKFNKTS